MNQLEGLVRKKAYDYFAVHVSQAIDIKQWGNSLNDSVKTIDKFYDNFNDTYPNYRPRTQDDLVANTVELYKQPFAFTEQTWFKKKYELKESKHVKHLHHQRLNYADRIDTVINSVLLDRETPGFIQTVNERLLPTIQKAMGRVQYQNLTRDSLAWYVGNKIRENVRLEQRDIFGELAFTTLVDDLINNFLDTYRDILDKELTFIYDLNCIQVFN